MTNDKSPKKKTVLDLDKALEEISKKLRPEANAPGICVGASQSNTGTPTKSGGCTCTCCSHKSYYQAYHVAAK